MATQRVSTTYFDADDNVRMVCGLLADDATDDARAASVRSMWNDPLIVSCLAVWGPAGDGSQSKFYDAKPE